MKYMIARRYAPLLSGLLATLLLWPASLLALSSDSDKPMEIVADNAELDDQKGTTVYRGDVEVTQGTLFMSGHTLTVYYDENKELERAILEGDRAYYKQLPDDSDVYDEAWAQRMERYFNDGMIILIEDAKVVQEDVTFTGRRIEYDTINSHVVAKSTPEEGDPAATTEEKDGEDGRVRVIISPKKQSGDGEE